MDERRYIRSAQTAVLAASAGLILLLIFAWVFTGPGNEWKEIQRAYIRTVKEFAIQSGDTVSDFPVPGILQYEIPDLKRNDRCITCHSGMENPLMENARQPHAMHPGNIFLHHPPYLYGCSFCHGGQGRALDTKTAHGDESGAGSQPMFREPYIQSSCGKCHLSIFGQEESLAGAEVFKKGQEIFLREGCLGCHKARGVGGILGPDLTEQGEKAWYEYDFRYIESEQTVPNWLKEHFMDPEMISPGSNMLKVDLPEEELDALTTFVLGLTRPEISFDYLSINTLNEFRGNRPGFEASGIFSMACSGCHGRAGQGKAYTEFRTGVPAILMKGFRQVASTEYINFTLLKGRSQRLMGTWMPSISGLDSLEIEQLAGFIKTQGDKFRYDFEPEKIAAAEAVRGKDLFEENCAICHGREGSGDVAIALNRKSLLRNADDRYLFNTLLLGRGNATMPSWAELGENALYDLVSYIRTWQDFSPESSGLNIIGADTESGKLAYLFLCSRCHGQHGQGETGPAIINADFLEIATDDFLYSTIAFGRDHTAMFGWKTDVYNHERPDNNDIENIIAFMRAEAARHPEYIYPGTNPGDSQKGKLLFAEHCAECHGENGEGKAAPALNNQEFLNAASNGHLMASVSLGRDGTAMPAWGKSSTERPVLTGKDRQDLVAWIREWQRVRIRF